MQKLRNNVDVLLKEWPTVEQWNDNPVGQIKFTVSNKKMLQKGDRILAITRMATTGPNSGSIVDIYYVVEDVVSYEPNKVLTTDNDVVATAKRIEL